MARLTDALMTPGVAYNLPGNNNPMLNLVNGGQHGYAPDLNSYISNQAYVSRPLICLVLQAPKIFTRHTNSEQWTSSLKSLFELHAKQIDGLNAGLTVDTDEHAVGGGGEMQEEIVNVTRARSQPSFTFQEKYGRPIQALLGYWIRYGLMDPETKYALMTTDPRYQATDQLADWYSATMMFIQPDPLHRNVDKAWLTTNMYPKSDGDVSAKRDLTSGQELLELNIEFSGISQVGLGVNAFAQRLLDGLSITGADPFTRNAFTTDAKGTNEWWTNPTGAPSGDMNGSNTVKTGYGEGINEVIAGQDIGG